MPSWTKKFFFLKIPANSKKTPFLRQQTPDTLSNTHPRAHTTEPHTFNLVDGQSQVNTRKFLNNNNHPKLTNKNFFFFIFFKNVCSTWEFVDDTLQLPQTGYFYSIFFTCFYQYTVSDIKRPSGKTNRKTMLCYYVWWEREK